MKILVVISAVISLLLWSLYLYFFLLGPDRFRRRKLSGLFIRGESPFQFLRSLGNPKLYFNIHYQQNQWFIFFSAFFSSTVTAVLAALYF